MTTLADHHLLGQGPVGAPNGEGLSDPQSPGPDPPPHPIGARMSVSTTIIMPIGHNIICFADHNGSPKPFPEAKIASAGRPAQTPCRTRGRAEWRLTGPAWVLVMTDVQ